ncbi:hypothetical protein J19TS2_59470 [Cohnella xylanilytica]|uniref:hypothetical protein n=1 Tax=Cohnella xylanilytica TaxID=557555 RepID=UPI001B078D6C|nr:hypothetical protein [Cohnella xylanilytica]GIO16392.1 hypothetical protein J19TS2_59470 [Cohnella xylanilytica]
MLIDDDLIVPNHMEVMLRESQDADLVYGDAEIFEYVLKNGLRHAISLFLFAYEHDPELFRRYNTRVPSGSLYQNRLHERHDPPLRSRKCGIIRIGCCASSRQASA